MKPISQNNVSMVIKY